jgi:hypothetical protein
MISDNDLHWLCRYMGLQITEPEREHCSPFTFFQIGDDPDDYGEVIFYPDDDGGVNRNTPDFVALAVWAMRWGMRNDIYLHTNYDFEAETANEWPHGLHSAMFGYGTTPTEWADAILSALFWVCWHRRARAKPKGAQA